MGWIGRYDSRPTAEIVREEIEEGGSCEVLANSGKYWAVRVRDTGQVFALVALTRREGRGYVLTKLITEDMGPNERKCPVRILSMLTPTDSEYANEWRQACRDNAEKKKAAPTLKVGDVIEIPAGIAFTNGETATRFTYRGGFRFTTERGTGVRFPKGWRTSYEWCTLTPTV